jgi:coenzyme F420-reducing hydrogenase delta subunit
MGQDLQIEYWAKPGYENSYGRLGLVRLKRFMFYAGDEQPGWCGVPREALGLRCAGAKFDRPDRLKRFAPPTETSFMNPRALRTLVFYCSNHLEAGQFSGLVREHEGDMLKTISLPCSGKVDIPYLLKAFETGADGVAIVTCPKNECRHFEGNLRAHKRAEAVEGLLEEIGLAAGRMAVFECGKQDTGAVLGEIKQFIERVRELPPTDATQGAANKQESQAA